MKCQFLICLLVLFISTISAKPVGKRGLLGDTVGKAVKVINRLLYHGIGTFFDPVREGGSQGACGPFSDVNSQIVAMNAEQYGDMSKKSHWCGKRVKICYQTKCTIATVTDACPGCSHGCLDLTPSVWGQLENDPRKGIIPITWEEYMGDNSDDSDEDDEST